MDNNSITSEAYTSCFLVGLPKTGKSTFLAALWHVVTADEVEDSLKLHRLEGDKTHLNAIVDAWSSALEIPRTLVQDMDDFSVLLTDRSGNHVTRFVIPDRAGEVYERQWSHREVTADYANLLETATGGIVMIHPSEVYENTFKSNLGELAAALESENPDRMDTHPELVQWDPKLASTQVKLVELLQIASDLCNSRPLQIAVIVSAWDLVADSKVSPELWLERRLPMLADFLKSNERRFTIRVFGMSCQGGSLDQSETLLEEGVPSKRIRVVESGKTDSHDPTTPLKWLVGQE